MSWAKKPFKYNGGEVRHNRLHVPKHPNCGHHLFLFKLVVKHHHKLQQTTVHAGKTKVSHVFTIEQIALRYQVCLLRKHMPTENEKQMRKQRNKQKKKSTHQYCFTIYQFFTVNISRICHCLIQSTRMIQFNTIIIIQ